MNRQAMNEKLLTAPAWFEVTEVDQDDGTMNIFNLDLATETRSRPLKGEDLLANHIAFLFTGDRSMIQWNAWCRPDDGKVYQEGQRIYGKFSFNPQRSAVFGTFPRFLEMEPPAPIDPGLFGK